MKKILFALCEGPHDVASLYRILRVNGLQKYSKPIGEFPSPLDSYFTKEAAGEDLERLKLDEVRNRRLPSVVLAYGDDALVLLYVIGGDSKAESRKNCCRTSASCTAAIPWRKKSERVRQPSARYYISSMRIKRELWPGCGRFVVSYPKY